MTAPVKAACCWASGVAAEEAADLRAAVPGLGAAAGDQVRLGVRPRPQVDEGVGRRDAVPGTAAGDGRPRARGRGRGEDLGPAAGAGTTDRGRRAGRRLVRRRPAGRRRRRPPGRDKDRCSPRRQARREVDRRQVGPPPQGVGLGRRPAGPQQRDDTPPDAHPGGHREPPVQSRAVHPQERPNSLRRRLHARRRAGESAQWLRKSLQKCQSELDELVKMSKVPARPGSLSGRATRRTGDEPGA